ncbi:lectin [Lysobacter sp. A03]|uniref:lectin n=1 Tax=Lysobacter sp. A03 TaxID=1199154 RepID=UPI0005B6C0B8|nr:lectin [Lysobacter sp. A03]KIQ97219.1 serine/threonine protein kinase [Lysobacter sp. A03]
MHPYRLFPTAVSLAVVVALTACNVPSPEGAGTDVAHTESPAAGQLDQPYEDVPPATAPPGSVMPGQSPATDSQAHWNGFGDAQFGMDDEQVKLVWPGELMGSAAEGSSCYHLSPAGQTDISRFAMMLEDGSFVRYSVSDEEIVAPGGGKRGMDAAQIDALYPGKVTSTAHKYVADGQYLRIEEGGGPHVLVFETDAAGTVTEWRVGLPPQVDYVEGCS